MHYLILIYYTIPKLISTITDYNSDKKILLNKEQSRVWIPEKSINKTNYMEVIYVIQYQHKPWRA
jgi:hypothetical protein